IPNGGRSLTHVPIEPNKDGAPGPAPACRGCALTRGLAFKLAALGLTAVSALGGTGLARWLRNPPSRPLPAAAPKPPRLFRDWDKPDLVLLLSAEQHGYLLPCGCSDPQYGGLERRYNFLRQLRERGWPVVAVDLGDIAQREGPAKLANQQGLIKYRYTMKALKAMDYTAVGVGANEAAPSLLPGPGEYAQDDACPR